MKPTFLFVLALASACAVADTPHPTDFSTVEFTPRWNELDHEAFQELTLQDSVRSIEWSLEQTKQLGVLPRAQAAESLRSLSVNCAYTRASMQIVFALHQVASTVDIRDIDPSAREDWKQLERGLAAHVAVLDALGFDLPPPSRGDHLFEGIPDGVLVDRATLAASADPLGVTTLLFDEITAATERLDTPNLDLLELNRQQRDEAVGYEWRLRWHLWSWHKALKSAGSSVKDSDSKVKVDTMIHALDTFSSLGC